MSNLKKIQIAIFSAAAVCFLLYFFWENKGAGNAPPESGDNKAGGGHLIAQSMDSSLVSRRTKPQLQRTADSVMKVESWRNEIAAIVETDGMDSEHDLHRLIQTIDFNDIDDMLGLVNEIKVPNYWVRGQIATHYRWIDFNPEESLADALLTWNDDMILEWFDVLVARYGALDPKGAISWVNESENSLVKQKQDLLYSSIAAEVSKTDGQYAMQIIQPVKNSEIRQRAITWIVSELSYEDAAALRDEMTSRSDREAATLRMLSIKAVDDPQFVIDEIQNGEFDNQQFKLLEVAAKQKLSAQSDS